MNRKARKMNFLLTEEEDQLLEFAMKVTGLDRTTTLRLMMRRGVIDEIARYRENGGPKLPEFIRQVVENF